MLRLLHVTDTHLVAGAPPARPPVHFADAVHALSGRTTDDLAAQVLSALSDEAAFDLILHTGDVVDVATADAYRWSNALLAGLGCPLLVTPGNHDDVDLLGAAFGPAASATCAWHDVGPWRVVTASTAWAGRQGGRFGPHVLAEFERALATDRPVVVGTHHPPCSPCPHPDCTVVDADAFLDVISRHGNVAAVLSGHLHLAAEEDVRGTCHLVTPSTCLQLDHVHPLPDHNHAATPVGARAVELRDDGSLLTEVRWFPIR